VKPDSRGLCREQSRAVVDTATNLLAKRTSIFLSSGGTLTTTRKDLLHGATYEAHFRVEKSLSCPQLYISIKGRSFIIHLSTVHFNIKVSNYACASQPLISLKSNKRSVSKLNNIRWKEKIGKVLNS
jgi:hypothetical protein